MHDINDLYKTFKSIDKGNEKKWSKSFFISLVKLESTICLFSKPEKRGYLIARVLKDEVEVIALLVDVSYRRTGLAKYLLEELKKIAKQRHALKIILEVSISNKSAIALYKKIGFVELATRKNYYIIKDKRVDAKLMCLYLSE
ncbi:GNAT family N-acetyltransferase [Alphaproteobacteria bacterium]|nr:GNAT family N-acetyltransferase [Alphaproteobacteria bacterium]